MTQPTPKAVAQQESPFAATAARAKQLEAQVNQMHGEQLKGPREDTRRAVLGILSDHENWKDLSDTLGLVNQGLTTLRDLAEEHKKDPDMADKNLKRLDKDHPLKLRDTAITQIRNIEPSDRVIDVKLSDTFSLKIGMEDTIEGTKPYIEFTPHGELMTKRVQFNPDFMQLDTDAYEHICKGKPRNVRENYQNAAALLRTVERTGGMKKEDLQKAIDKALVAKLDKLESYTKIAEGLKKPEVKS